MFPKGFTPGWYATPHWGYYIQGIWHDKSCSTTDIIFIVSFI
jgi:hypothetical protein